MTQLICRFDLLTGFSSERCAFVGFRYESEGAFRGGAVKSSLMTKLQKPYTTWPRDPIAGLWYSPSDRVYVAFTSGDVMVFPFPGAVADQVTFHERLPSTMPGVFGLDDSHVYFYAGSPKGGRVFMFDGQSFSELPAPPAWLISMHGCAPDCLYGVSQGGVYRFDGKAWHAAVQAPEVFAGVWVQSPDEIYACSRGGLLLDGSADGFVERTRWKGPLVGVAKWQDALWLGGEEAGLLRVQGKGTELESVRPKLFTRYLDARENLMFSANEVVMESKDGVKFMGWGRGVLESWGDR